MPCLCGSSIVACPVHNKGGDLPNPGFDAAMRKLGQLDRLSDPTDDERATLTSIAEAVAERQASHQAVATITAAKPKRKRKGS